MQRPKGLKWPFISALYFASRFPLSSQTRSFSIRYFQTQLSDLVQMDAKTMYQQYQQYSSL